MTELAGEAGYRRDHRCQTDGCPNDFAVVTVRVDDSEVTMLCDSCQLTFNLAILQQLAASGALVLPEQAPAGDGAAQQLPVVLCCTTAIAGPVRRRHARCHPGLPVR